MRLVQADSQEEMVLGRKCYCSGEGSGSGYGDRDEQWRVECKVSGHQCIADGRLRPEIVPSIVDKALGNTRAATKKKGTDLCAMFVEVENGGEGVVVSPRRCSYLTARLTSLLDCQQRPQRPLLAPLHA